VRQWASLAEFSDAQRATARRSAALGLGLLVLASIGLGATKLGRGALDQALAVAADAHPGWLVLAGLGFGSALLCSAAAWGVGLRTCGGTSAFPQVAARYAIGSLVNSAAPAHLGGAVRIGLLSRTLPDSQPVWRTCGVAAAVGAARTLALAALVVAAAVVGRVPLWPACALVLAVGAAVAIAARFSTRVAGRTAALLQAFREPRRSIDVLGWTTCGLAARLGATVAVVAGLGIPNQLSVAVVLLAAMALAGLVPLTPGNIGAGAGAATLALHGTGVGVGTALALGMTFQVVETFSAVVLGLAGTAVVSTPGTPLRRWSLAAVGVAAMLLAATVGIASVDLV
jgi:uncharacterized membrane protein YbhN (UPF0104 family)